MRLILISPNGRIPDRRTVVSMGRSRTDYGLARLLQSVKI
jgi:hypothetical protein